MLRSYGQAIARVSRGRLLVVLACSLALCGCSESPSILDPKGEGAHNAAELWWLMLWIAAVVFFVVVGFLVVSIFRARRTRDATDEEPRWAERFIVLAGVILPSLILISIFVYSLTKLSGESQAGSDALTIDVIGHDWWWEADYGNGAVTANEIHIPVGERVQLRLTSNDVIHSFWVPQLQAKVDMIPGRTNVLWLEADEAGRYRGQCAEFCGLQHSKMLFYVVADAPEDFDNWLANERRDFEAPGGGFFTAQEFGRGGEVFLDSTCAGCHTVRGTEATATVGPDLTHFGRRETIAAGVLSNTPENLARWITDPQSIKPGVNMPPTDLSEDELSALVGYLESLR